MDKYNCSIIITQKRITLVHKINCFLDFFHICTMKNILDFYTINTKYFVLIICFFTNPLKLFHLGVVSMRAHITCCVITISIPYNITPWIRNNHSAFLNNEKSEILINYRYPKRRDRFFNKMFLEPETSRSNFNLHSEHSNCSLPFTLFIYPHLPQVHEVKLSSTIIKVLLYKLHLNFSFSLNVWNENIIINLFVIFESFLPLTICWTLKSGSKILS